MAESVDPAKRFAQDVHDAFTRSPALRVDADDAPDGVDGDIDCGARLPLCHAVCCRLQVVLSQGEVDAGVARWNEGRPYVLAQSGDGRCCHQHPATLACGIYADRPRPCRAYDCRRDLRVWLDFDKRVPNAAYIASIESTRAPVVGSEVVFITGEAGRPGS